MILRAANTDRLIDGKPRTVLTAAQASGSSTITVESIANFAVGNWVILGVLGEERTEVIRVHISSAPSGSTITLNSNTAYRHEIGTPVYFVDYDQVEFSRAETVAGSKTTLATSTMTVDLMDTIYDDLANTTGFGFYRFKNSASSAFGAYSDPIPYAGYDLDAVANILDRALSMVSTKVSSRLKYEDLFRFLNDAITIANAKNTRWAEAKVLEHELDTIATGDWEWALPTNIARLNDPSAIISLRVRGNAPMKYKPQREWNQYTRDLIVSYITTDVAVIDTEIVLNNSKGFADAGTISIEGDTISYTGNTRATNTLTGVTGITAAHTANPTTYAFQTFSPGEPFVYTITSEGRVRAWPICSSTINNRVLYMDYYRRIPTIDSMGDLILISNITPFVEYVAYRIKKHMAGGTLALTDEEFKKFAAAIEECVTRDTPGEPIRVSII